MGPAISDVLPFAVVVMISPIPIIGVILILFSPRARSNGPAFLLGWVIGLAVLSAIVYVVADAANVATDSDASDASSTLKMVLGLVLVLLAVRRWRSRPAPGETPPPPKWMAAIDSVTPIRAFELGIVLSAVNPKNLLLTVAAAVSVAQSGVSTGDAAVALGVFVLIASLSIAGPVVYYLLAGASAKATLDTWKAWFEHNNATVMAVMLLVIGVVLFAKGLGPISA